MWVEPVVLEGDFIRLEPLEVRHAADLYPFLDEETLRYMMMWVPCPSLESFEDHVQSVIDLSGYISFAMIEKASGKAVGTSSYFEIREPYRSLEVGGTLIGAPYRAGYVNPEAKLLMLRHAFETLGCVRVQLKTDGRNARSIAAMRKLGAKVEGVLRRHMICRDGFVRDTVVLSITDAEWPGVKAGLEVRLAVCADSRTGASP